MNKRTESAMAKARHNLKNPVNAILGYSEMLMKTARIKSKRSCFRPIKA